MPAAIILAVQENGEKKESCKESKACQAFEARKRKRQDF